MRDLSQKKQLYQTKEDFVYQLLREAILNCDIEPGEKLIIDQLSQELEISTIPIRAAIQRLGMERLVIIKPHSPAQASPLSLEMVRETFALLASLETTAYEQIAQKADPQTIRKLELLINSMEKTLAQNDGHTWVSINIAFHRQIAEATQMPMLIEFTNRTLDQWRRLSQYYFKEVTSTRIQTAQQEHRKIIELIREKKVDQLKSLAQTHNLEASKAYLQLIKD
jgi:DNA-binding GntR family transcriptional regulator